jgi:transposase
VAAVQPRKPTNDAEAIVEAVCAAIKRSGGSFEGADGCARPCVTRQAMQASPRGRFVAVKTEDQQARAMLFRTRQMFVGQRTQMINASC